MTTRSSGRASSVWRTRITSRGGQARRRLRAASVRAGRVDPQLRHALADRPARRARCAPWPCAAGRSGWRSPRRRVSGRGERLAARGVSRRRACRFSRVRVAAARDGFDCEFADADGVAERSAVVQARWSSRRAVEPPRGGGRSARGDRAPCSVARSRAWRARSNSATCVTECDPPRIVAGGRDLAGGARMAVRWRRDTHALSRGVRRRGPDALQAPDDAHACPGAGGRLGPMLAAGLTLRPLPSVRRRARRCRARNAIGRGVSGVRPLRHPRAWPRSIGTARCIIGDSHEYGDTIEPFDKPQIDDLILDYLRTLR